MMQKYSYIDTQISQVKSMLAKLTMNRPLTLNLSQPQTQAFCS